VQAHDDVVGDTCHRLGVIGVVSLSDPLHFQVQKDALHHCIVPTITLATHAHHQAMPIEYGVIGRTGVLAAPIRVDVRASPFRLGGIAWFS
jgi:hypothetical protein